MQEVDKIIVELADYIEILIRGPVPKPHEVAENVKALADLMLAREQCKREEG